MKEADAAIRKATAWLSERVPDLGAVLSIRQFPTGRSNPTFLVAGERRRVVMRVQPPGVPLRGAHRVDREYRVMKALENSPVPTPPTIVGCFRDSPVDGRMFFVMGYAEGRTFLDPAAPGLDKAARSRLYDAMNAVLAALHDCDPFALGLGDFGKPHGYLQRQFAVWRRQYLASQTRPIAAMDRLTAQLADRLPDDVSKPCLTHGDFRLDNMIFSPDGEMRALIDWELSTLGHPIADLAYQCMQWRLPHDSPAVARLGSAVVGLGGVDRNACGIPDEADYVEAYRRRRRLPPIADWNRHIAFAFFRLAAILQGVHRRQCDGVGSQDGGDRDGGDRHDGDIVAELAERGLAELAERD